MDYQNLDQYTASELLSEAFAIALPLGDRIAKQKSELAAVKRDIEQFAKDCDGPELSPSQKADLDTRALDMALFFDRADQLAH